MNNSRMDTVEQVYAAFQERDLGLVDRYFDPEAEILQSELLPWGGHYKGHDGVVAFLTALLQHVDPQLTSERLFDAGDHVIQIGRTTGRTVTGGTRFDLPEIHVWQLTAGKITRMEIYIDVPGMLKALP